MAYKRLLDWDPLTRTQTWWEMDTAENQWRIIESQDVEPILELNKQRHNDTDYQAKGIKNSWMHAATIPNSVITKWKREKGVDVFNKDHAGAVNRLLNDPEWRYLRTGNARLNTKR